MIVVAGSPSMLRSSSRHQAITKSWSKLWKQRTARRKVVEMSEQRDVTLPLAGIRVVEFAGLAPGPMAGMILADFGATVIRVDRPSVPPTVAPDVLCRGKRSIAIDSRVPAGRKALRRLVDSADVLIDPFRPCVMERMGLGPETFVGNEGSNKRLVYARLVGFTRIGRQKDMAGHDINYLASSGVLSLMPGDEKPMFPANLLGDFAGGGLTSALGILLALMERQRSGLGQVVNTDMVSGTRYVSTFLMLTHLYAPPPLSGERGKTTLDGGAPFYDVYTCADGRWMTVGCLEPQFFRVFLDKFLGVVPPKFTLSDGWRPTYETQADRSAWPLLKEYLKQGFRMHPRDFWTEVFHGTDACTVPVLSLSEAAASTPSSTPSSTPLLIPTPHPHLGRTPSVALRDVSPQDVKRTTELIRGQHTEEVLSELGLTDEEKRELMRDGALGKDCARL
ncbi:CoA-transferase family III [Sparassis latifolia]|uniref:Isopenicillin N epimerase component 2 n=1 Tax=Sparassis crispa TaxID=139825 RepID=A0A401H058_9APHY|nr:Isopenicillin N epimerase component 2 [Sparassis crispa]GBE87798.1 Isopenicillin N epimerase component 2 [Sparassis crispa]